MTKGFYNRPEDWGSKTFDDHFVQSTFRPIVPPSNETRRVFLVHRVRASGADLTMINRNAILPFIFVMCNMVAYNANAFHSLFPTVVTRKDFDSFRARL